MRIKTGLLLVAILLFAGQNCLQAQEPGEGRGDRPRGGGGQGMSRTALLQVEAVQQELELTDEQLEGAAALRPNRGRRGGGEGEGPGAGRGEGGERGNRDRGERGERGPGRGGPGGPGGAERVEAEMTALQEILLPHQMERLNQIFVQVAGSAVVNDPVIAKGLGISDQQQQQFRDKQQEMRSQIREMMASGDRDAMREEITEMRQQIDADLMALLTDEQQNKLEAMKGAAFDMPEDAMRRGEGRRGRGPGGGGDRADF